MIDGYIGSIVPWAAKFEPQDWLFCDGRLLSIQTYPALYSILGTRFGGNGQTTFGLPYLRQKFLIGQGASGVPNMPTLSVSNTGGYATGQLTGVPSHSHGFPVTVTATLSAAASGGTQAAPGANVALGGLNRIANSTGVATPLAMYASGQTGTIDVGKLTVTAPTVDTTNGTGYTGVAAGAQFSTLPPNVTLNFIIAVYGEYPVKP